MAVYSLDGFKCKKREDLEFEAIEAIWLEVKVGRGKQVLLCFLYRTPSGDDEILDKLSAMLDKAVLEGKEVLVLGGVNPFIGYKSIC